MDTKLLRNQISRFNRHTFARFVAQLFEADAPGMTFEPLRDAGEDVFYQPFLDSYGDSIHRVYVLHFPPLELFHPFRDLKMDDPVLIRRLVRIRNLYKGRVGHWGMVSPVLKADDALKELGIITNLFGCERNVYEETLIPAYQRAKRFCGLKKPRVIVGSCDSICDLVPEKTQRVFEQFCARYADGVAVSIRQDGVTVSDFISERPMSGGVLAVTESPYEPIFASTGLRQRSILTRFESLLAESPSESDLEDFIVAHYKYLFGSQYDRVETQLWLRFPDLDIGSRERRLDVFLRNSVLNDWDLFEIKRPVSVAGSYRDVPVIAKEVTNAIHQVQNYARILMQDKAKRHFASQGIEYYEPRLNVVIGRTPQIPHEQWRWLRTANEGAAKIITFDDLLVELKSRLTDRFAVLNDAEQSATMSGQAGDLSAAHAK